MQRWKNIFFNIILCLNCLLLLFVLAGDKLQVPVWLQVVGRMHTLLLHFPIVLLIVYIVWSIALQVKVPSATTGPEDEIGKWLLLSAAGTAAVTAGMGFLLSKEQGYNPQALWWHKWGGVAVSLFSFLWYAWRNSIHRRKYLPQLSAVFIFLLIVFTGHQGSNITHGENYLLAPVSPEKLKPVVPIEKALVYTDMVRPILEAKCMTCHSSKKAKGELIMETEALLLKGGKHGALWAIGQPDLSLLMQRIHLPAAEKKHMPPAGKPQLDEEESAVLFQWIKAGASFKQKVMDVPATDSLRLLANKLFDGSKEDVYDFSAASDAAVEQLNNTNRVVHPLALGSPGLAVNFYNRQNYSTNSLKDLLVLKEQIVQMDMAYMPLKDEDMIVIAQFSSLRKLNLNFSTVPGKSLGTLSKLPLLNHLSLSGTTVTAKDIAALTTFPKLRSAYLWNAPVSAVDMNLLRKRNSNIQFETGFMNDTLVLKLNPPVMETDERIINGAPLVIKLKHYIKGAVIRYTTDGTNPDSSKSLLYSPALALDSFTVFKARAFKPGWAGSDSIVATFYKNSFRADSIRSVTPLDSFYKGGKKGAKILVDAEKGGLNYSSSGKWLGFRRNNMEMLLHYNSPVTISSVTLSSLVDVGGFIMPPAYIEVWGGSSEKNLVRLARITPQQPDTIRPSYMRGFDCNFHPAHVSYLKVVAAPLTQLPPWHPAKKQKGWLFTDEILVN